MSRVAIVTLGCPKNAVDSENLGGLVATHGHELTDAPDEADVIMVNTCGFIDPARRETIEEVLELAELKKSGDLSALVLTGCLVARSHEDLVDALPEVDAFVDFAAYPRIGDIVSDVASGTLTEKVHGTPGTRFDPAWWDASMVASPRIRFGRAPWAYVKIAEGCDRGCTFCAIPLMRGKFRSRTIETIVDEVESLATQGVSEFSLVSQDSVMWGRDTGEGDLAALLDHLEAIDGVRRLRLMYLHPQGVTPGLIDRILGSEKVVHYFDLSFQHASKDVLKGMGRWGSRERFIAMASTIREKDPRAALRATFITSFPGETDDDVEQIESLLEEIDLDWIGLFTYSPEEGTRSFDMPDRVDDLTARSRLDRLASIADRAMERRAASLVGERLEVLVERFDIETETWTGRSHREAPEVDGEISIASDAPVNVGDYLDGLVTAHEGTDLTVKHEI